MLLWLAHWARNFLWDTRRDCLWQRGAFPFCDFGLPRTGSSSVVYPSSLDFLCSSSSISSSSAWALVLIWNGLSFAKSFNPTIAPQNPAIRLLERRWGFWCPWAYIMAGWVLFPYGRQALFACLRHAFSISAYEMHCHQYFYGMTWIASLYGMCIQWHLYEAAWIWRLRVPLGIGRNLFRLTFPLWALGAVNSLAP